MSDYIPPHELNTRIFDHLPDIVETDNHYTRREERYRFIPKVVYARGECQFRAVSDQLFKNDEHHDLVRQTTVDQLKAQPQRYAHELAPHEDFDLYCEKMKRQTTWGDNLTLKAISDAYKVKIVVLSSREDLILYEYVPYNKIYKAVIHLSYIQDEHYDSMYAGTKPRNRNRALKLKNLGLFKRIVLPKNRHIIFLSD